MKQKRTKRLLSLLTSLCMLLALLPVGALAEEQPLDGSGGIDVTALEMTDTTWTCNGGTAEWKQKTGTLTLRGTGTITGTGKNPGIYLPQSAKLVVERGASWTVTGANGDPGYEGIYGTLTVNIAKGASLTAQGGSSNTNTAGFGLLARENLNVTVAENGTFTAVGGRCSSNSSQNGFGLSSNGEVHLKNNGNITVQIEGSDRSGIGIQAGTTLIIEGSGILHSAGYTGIYGKNGLKILGGTVVALGQGDSGYGINTGTLTVDAGATVLAVGPKGGVKGTVKGEGMVKQFTAAGVFGDSDETLDLSTVDAAKIYVYDGGIASWQPGTPNKLTLTNVKITSGGIQLPAGETEITLQGDNAVAGGIALEQDKSNSLTLSGTGGLTVTGEGENPPFTGVTWVNLDQPQPGYFALAKAGPSGDTKGLPGTPLVENAVGSYFPRDTDREFELKYQSRNGKCLLIVKNGFGGNIVVAGEQPSISFDEDGGDFYGWEFYDGTTMASLGTSIENVAEIQLADAKNAQVSITSADRDFYVRAITEKEEQPSGGSSSPSTYAVVYKANYENAPKDIRDSGYRAGANVTLKGADAFAAPADKVFAGWAESADGEAKYQGGEVMKMPSKTLNLYAVWQDIMPGLNKTDHMAYVAGYPDGTVRPGGYITREETATIFYRLLNEPTRAKYETDTHSFSDVAKSRWSNTAVATLANAGILNGYPDGTFRPTARITRAEFAAIAARFDSDTYSGENLFPDIAGHWAANEINRAAQKGWVEGDPDGRFRPNDNITRAEAVTLVNRVLERAPETADDLLAGMRTFKDNLDTAQWYYLALQEAANGHDYKRKTDEIHETWTALQ